MHVYNIFFFLIISEYHSLVQGKIFEVMILGQGKIFASV